MEVTVVNPGGVPPATITIGSPARIEWAEEIRVRVCAEFDRVSLAFQEVARNRTGRGGERTGAVLAILEDKRADVMACDDSGCFIRDLQELSDQVRRMIASDPRYT